MSTLLDSLLDGERSAACTTNDINDTNQDNAMFHVPAHKHVGPNPPAQVLVFISRTEAGTPLKEVPYHPIAVVIGGRRCDLALHKPEDSTLLGWRISDPVSGILLVSINKPHVDTLMASTAVRDHALNHGEDEFHERLYEARRLVTNRTSKVVEQQS